MNGAGKHTTIANILAGWAVISRAERIQWIADSVEVVKQLADLAAPCLRTGQGVSSDKIKVPRDVSLQVNQKRLVARAIIGAKHGNVGIVISPVTVRPS